VVENAIEAVLTEAGISFRKTGRAERLEGFDQAPDFVVPNEFNPRVVIEAKLTEDDGTARDKGPESSILALSAWPFNLRVGLNSRLLPVLQAGGLAFAVKT